MPSGSTILPLVVPGAGIDRSFQGITRNDSQRLFLNWLRGEGREQLTKVLQFSVATTAFDPVAGNPNGLMAQMGEVDFAAGLPSQRTGQGAVMRNRFSVGLEARFGSYSISGRDTNVYTIPIRTESPIFGSEVIIDAPVTLVEISGSYSYSGSLGIGFPINIPYVPNWTLTPMGRVGAVGSVDLGAVGAMWSLSITSGLYILIQEGTCITIGNMVANLQTFLITIQDYDISYNIRNNIFRNGIIIRQRVRELFGRVVQLSGFFVDIRFSGDSVYIRSYQQLGTYLLFDGTRVGLTYIRDERGYSGFTEILE